VSRWNGWRGRGDDDSGGEVSGEAWTAESSRRSMWRAVESGGERVVRTGQGRRRLRRRGERRGVDGGVVEGIEEGGGGEWAGAVFQKRRFSEHGGRAGS
jgi:hypothetical protein